MQARNFTTNVPKILDLKSSSEQIFFRKLWLGAPGIILGSTYALLSSSQSLLFAPKGNCSTLGNHAFAHAAPVLWNFLPSTIRTSSSFAIFKKQIHTFLFREAFILLEYQ